MKKWLIGTGLVLVIAVICVYVFIPSHMEVSAVRFVHCNPQAVFRQTGSAEGWKKWWRPGGSDDVYQVTAGAYPVTEIYIQHDGRQVKSTMSILSTSRKDSSMIYWQSSLAGGSGPFSRIRQYLFALNMKKSMNGVLSMLSPFVENEKNIYGMSIGEASTSDTLLIVTKAFFPQYPGTPEIYQLLGKLRQYAGREGAVEKGFPIANVTLIRDSGYQLMTAVTIDRILPGRGDIVFRRMVPAKFLVAEVKGGDHTIRAAVEHMNEYIADHQRTVMAIPFQTLVTDRIKETDTSRWTTWLYCPVF